MKGQKGRRCQGGGRQRGKRYGIEENEEKGRGERRKGAEKGTIVKEKEGN